MKILVFGAGVLGCNLARNFFRAGKDVTLLARGAWGESIPKNGLRIKDKFSPRMSVSRIPVVTELKAEDKYDVIFVVLRYTQLDAILDAVSAGDDLPEVLKWKDSYLSLDSFVLVLGESYTGPVTVNLAHIPHILLGGSTGSGKSVLLKLLLMQALRKGAEVYIADFKGGVDFPKVWHEKCRMCFAEEDLCNILDQLVEELERRKSAFKALGCPNIDAYNETTEQPLPRLIFACDEVAEMLDKTGADNERKKLLSQIESMLSTIARQGRAFGIHLILATQRPDATIIPGQIRNNMDFRVCGRADSVLSQIILDNTSAAEQIPKDARGRYLEVLVPSERVF